MTLRVSRDGSSSRVRLSLSHPSLMRGTHNFLYISSLGAATVTYSWVGKGSRDSSTSGSVPLVTRKVLMPRRWHTSMKPARCGYMVGSPESDMATCLGSRDSCHFSLVHRGSPPKPETSFRCSSMQWSSISSGPFHWTSVASKPWTRQQNKQLWVHWLTTGVICRHRWELMP